MKTIRYCGDCGIRLFRGRHYLCPLCAHKRATADLQASLERQYEEVPPRFRAMLEPDESWLLARKELPVSDRQPGFRATTEFEREDTGAPPGSLMGYNKTEAKKYWEWLRETGHSEMEN